MNSQYTGTVAKADNSVGLLTPTGGYRGDPVLPGSARIYSIRPTCRKCRLMGLLLAGTDCNYSITLLIATDVLMCLCADEL